MREESRQKEEEFILAEERRKLQYEQLLAQRRLEEQEEIERKREVQRIKQESYVGTLELKGPFRPKAEEALLADPIRTFTSRNLYNIRNNYGAAEIDNTENCLLIGIFNPPCKTLNDISHMFQGISVIDYKFDDPHQNLFLKFSNNQDENTVYQKLNGLVWHYDTLHKIQANFITEEAGISRISESCNNDILKTDIPNSPHGYCLISGLVQPIRPTKLNSFLMKHGGSNAYSNASKEVLASV